MASILKTDEIQSQNGGAVVKMQTLKHPSSSGNNITLDSSNNVSLGGTLSAGTIGGNVVLPTGTVAQVIQSQFNPSVESTSTASYQPSTVFKVIQKKQTSSKILATLSGGHGYVGQFTNGLMTTICQTSNSTSFTPTTTYSSSDDPTSNSSFGMEQIYNSSVTNTAPHSISWLFDSSGNEFEGFRCFFKSRTSGRVAVFHENNLSYITFTLMEVLQ